MTGNFTAPSGSPTFTTDQQHGLIVGDTIAFTENELPAGKVSGLVTGQILFISSVPSLTTLTVTGTLGAAPISVTETTSGSYIGGLIFEESYEADSLLGCADFKNSTKTVTTLTLTATVSGDFEFSDSESGSSLITTFGGTATRTWTRETPQTKFQINSSSPAIELGKFRLVNICCCWNCRWTTIIRNANSSSNLLGSIYSLGSTFEIPGTQTSIAGTGEDPVTTNGTYPLSAQIIWELIPPNIGNTIPRRYCNNEYEVDTVGARVKSKASFALSGVPDGPAAMDWAYTDSSGYSENGGPTTSITLPTAGSPIRSSIDACSASPSGWVQIVFTGDDSEETITATSNASLRLEFAFS